MISLEIRSADGTLKKSMTDEKEICMAYEGKYEKGDRIVASSDIYPVYMWFQGDSVLGEMMLYMKDRFIYVIPFDEARLGTNPAAFGGERHYLSLRYAGEKGEGEKVYRNLALNVYDLHENVSAFPHAGANVETRNESVFAARNAIDGIKAGNSHGEWPYQSWGINRNPDAELYIDFGREVCVDRIDLFLRGDFPHDSWWKQVTVRFSDGSSEKFKLKKTASRQSFVIRQRRVTDVKLCELIKNEDESPFPALTQIEVYGCE